MTVQTVCKRCDFDIEGPYNDQAMVGYWIDRGGNRMCHDNDHEGYFHVPHTIPEPEIKSTTGVDFHTKLHELEEDSENVEVRTIGRHCVEITRRGMVIAKAVRADDNSGWHFGAMVGGHMVNMGELYAWVPEVVGRKAILAILKELV